MAKPVVIAKSPAPQWLVTYVDLATGKQQRMLVMGSPTIDDALREANTSLAISGDFTITRIVLDKPNPVDTALKTVV